jgi:hypothetical protein
MELRQLAPLFGVSKSAADRIIDHRGPALALKQRKLFRKDTVLIVDGTRAPTRDHTIAEQPKDTPEPATVAAHACRGRSPHHVGHRLRTRGTRPASIAGRAPSSCKLRRG